MLRLSILIASLACCAATYADVLVLKNGDKLTGSLVSREDGKIIFNSDMLGQITVPDQDAIVQFPAPTPEEAAAKADEIIAAEDASDDAEEAAKDVEEIKSVTQSIIEAQTWFDDNIVPEGWSGKLTFGFSYLESNSETVTMNFGLNGKKDSAPNHYRYNLYYQYNKQTDQNGVEDKNQDTYGAKVGYDYDINKWLFFNSDLGYLRNMVKDIRHQVDLDVGLGIRILNEDNLKLDLIPAYTLQYKDAEGVSQKWYHLATLKETFSYKFNEIVRFEQTASGSIAPADVNDYQYKATAALISKLADWIDASISYQLTYDNTVGSNGTKKEQQVIFGLGVPY